MTEDQELKKGSTPLLILAVLSDNPRHGYAIAREIERRCADALKVGEGAWETQPSGPARRIYTLTDAGSAKLAASLKSWQRFSNAVNAVLGDALVGNDLGGIPYAQPT